MSSEVTVGKVVPKGLVSAVVNQFLATYLNGIRRGSLTNELQRLRTDIQKIINRGGDYL